MEVLKTILMIAFIIICLAIIVETVAFFFMKRDKTGYPSDVREI